MAEMPIEPRLAKCLLASLSGANCNVAGDQRESDEKTEGGCTEEMLSIAAMCSVDYPFISLKARASDERKQQRLGTLTITNISSG
jgi:HrpA-like RNA helicase